MGYMRHHASIVTTGDYDDALKKAREVAAGIFPWVSPVSPKAISGYRSFFIPPDGSKEGWGESDAGDEQRDRFVAYMLSTRYTDGSGPLDWAEIQYGDGDRKTLVVRHSDDGR